MSAKNNTRATRRACCVLIESPHGWILQLRDNIDGIWSPGRVSYWGGALESVDDGDPRVAAYRELYEETGLTAEMVDLQYIATKTYESTDIHGVDSTIKCECYVARIAEGTEVYVHEGAGRVDIAFDENIDSTSYEFSALAYELLMTRRLERT